MLLLLKRSIASVRNRLATTFHLAEGNLTLLASSSESKHCLLALVHTTAAAISRRRQTDSTLTADDIKRIGDPEVVNGELQVQLYVNKGSSTLSVMDLQSTLDDAALQSIADKTGGSTS